MFYDKDLQTVETLNIYTENVRRKQSFPALPNTELGPNTDPMKLFSNNFETN